MLSAWESFNRFPQFSCAKISVQRRILKLNKTPEPGMLVRGLFRKPLSWRRTKKKLLSSAHLPWRFRTPGGEIYDYLCFGPPSRRELISWGIPEIMSESQWPPA